MSFSFHSVSNIKFYLSSFSEMYCPTSTKLEACLYPLLAPHPNHPDKPFHLKDLMLMTFFYFTWNTQKNNESVSKNALHQQTRLFCTACNCFGMVVHVAWNPTQLHYSSHFGMGVFCYLRWAFPAKGNHPTNIWFYHHRSDFVFLGSGGCDACYALCLTNCVKFDLISADHSNCNGP